MNKTITKEEMKETAQDILKTVKICSAMIDVEAPGAGMLLIEALVDELMDMLPEGSRCTEGCCREAKNEETEPDRNNKLFDFGCALLALKQGKSVARKGWNGKNQFVELATCISYKGNAGEIVNCHHNNIGNKALAFVGTSGVQMGWLASQADMLAEDWYIVEVAPSECGHE